MFLPQHNYAISIYFEWVTIKWQTLYVQLKKGKRRPQYETKPTLELGWENGQKIIRNRKTRFAQKKPIEMKARNSNYSKYRK